MKWLALLLIVCAVCFNPARAGVPGPGDPDKGRPWAVIVPGTDENPPYIEKDGAKAEALMYHSLESWTIAGRKKFGAASTKYADRLVANANHNAGRIDEETLSLYKEAWQIYSYCGDQVPSEKAIRCAHALSEIYLRRHNYSEAENIAREATKLIEKYPDQNSLLLRTSLKDIVMACLAQSKPSEAATAYQRLVDSVDVPADSGGVSIPTLAELQTVVSKLTSINEHDTKSQVWNIPGTIEADYYTALRQAEWTGICVYRGYEKTSKIDFDNPPTATFCVEKIFAGTMLSQGRIFPLKFDFKEKISDKAPKDWKFSEDKMPRLGSKWIIFLADHWPAKGNPYQTIRGSKGRQPATEKNLEQMWLLLEIRYGQI